MDVVHRVPQPLPPPSHSPVAGFLHSIDVAAYWVSAGAEHLRLMSQNIL